MRFLVVRRGATALNWQPGSIEIPLERDVATSVNIGDYVTGEQSIALLSGSIPGMTYTPATGILAGTPTTDGTYDLNFRASDAASSAAADWTARTGAAGVLWAQRFQSQSDIDRWIYPAASGLMPTLESGGVIEGDSCMRQTVPAGGAVGARQWSRSMQPQPGDINQPGLAVGAGGTWIQEWNSSAHSYIAHPSYAGPHGSPSRSYPVMASEYWFQFRVRFSANRFAAGNSPGKMLYLSCNYNDPSQELILRGKGYGATTLSRAFSTYTNFAGAPNGALGNPQSSGEGLTEQREPGGFPLCTGNNPDACYLWQAGIWQTALIHFRPGRNNIAETLYEIYCAQPGETSYTLVHQKSDYVWVYDNSQAGSDGSIHGFGHNYVMLNPFTGGGGWDVTNAEQWYHEFDQLIFSLSPIACPQV